MNSGTRVVNTVNGKHGTIVGYPVQSAREQVVYDDDKDTTYYVLNIFLDAE